MIIMDTQAIKQSLDAGLFLPIYAPEKCKKN